MRASHVVAARFDDPNLVSCSGLAAVRGLGVRCDLPGLVAQHLTLREPAGVNAQVKVPALVWGMVAGADSIEDMQVLRSGGTGRLVGPVRAPSTLGSFLRTFTFGHVRQLDAVASRVLARLAAATPLLPGAQDLCFVDLDDTVRATRGYAKQGVGFGYSGVRGLNVLLATVSTPAAAPVVAATRLRKGSSNSTRGAGFLAAAALANARRAGATGVVVLRADSAFYGFEVVDAARRAGAYFSVTARMTPAVATAIAGIDEDRWEAIRYPQAVFDDEEGRWISDAEVAEVGFTAFTGRRRGQHVRARLLVRRVRRLGAPGQGELMAAYRYHAVFTDSPAPLVEAEKTHRAHAVVEQVISDLKNSALAHLPSGKFTANAAWTVLAALAFNLSRAAGCLAGGAHARATTATLRRRLIWVPGRLARSGRRTVMHLPQAWPWQDAWHRLFDAATGPPALAH